MSKPTIILGIVGLVLAGLAAAGYAIILFFSVLFHDAPGGPGPVEMSNQIVGEMLFGHTRARKQRETDFAAEKYFTGPLLEAGRAIVENDARALARILAASAPDTHAHTPVQRMDVNAPGKRGMTLVALAVLMESRACLAVLARHGAALNIAVPDPNPPKEYVVGENVTIQQNKAGSAPLSFAIRENDLALGRLLLEKGAHAEARLPGTRPISGHDAAIRNGDPALLPYLFVRSSERSEAVNRQLESWDTQAPYGTLLAYAIEEATNDRTDWLELLVAHGADVNGVNDKGDPVLADAYHGNQLRVVAWLLDHGANPLAPYHTAAGPRPVMPLMVEQEAYDRFVTWLPKRYSAAEAAHILALLKPYAEMNKALEYER